MGDFIYLYFFFFFSIFQISVTIYELLSKFKKKNISKNIPSEYCKWNEYYNDQECLRAKSFQSYPTLQPYGP